MFTGIIEELGTLHDIKRVGDDYQLTIKAEKILEDVKVGDSISVNGICLTVTSFTSQHFMVDVMPETVNATSLQHLSAGSKVNVERAMAANGRFGGHFVSGHVDGVGTITEVRPVANAVYFWIQASSSLLKYVVPKGSITVDGISLTVVDVTEEQFSISIIPHTLQETVLQFKQVGDLLNLECDMLAKYIDNLLEKREQPATKKGISLEVLSENGYL